MGLIRLRVAPQLSGAEAYGLRVLVDLSRLLPVSDAAADVVEVAVDHDAANEAPPFRVADGIVHVTAERLRWIADIAGAGAEQRSAESDRHGRIPAAANPLVATGEERKPVVHQVAATLRTAVREAAGPRDVWTLAPWPNGRRWAAALTHDVDVVAGWPLFTALRVLELARKADYRRAAASLRAAAAAAGGDPVTAALQHVLETERRHDAAATWFFLCEPPTLQTWSRGDATYDPGSRRARALLAAATGSGGEVGLHGSFDTWQDADLLREQRARLAALAGVRITGSRQHYLRLRPGATQRAIADAGFDYDATFGFADRNGFRLGVADVVPAWSDGPGAPLELDEVPLAWMDRALSKYAGVEEPGAWIADALELAAEARAAEGVWVGLWHPNLAPPLGFPGAPREYERLVAALAEARPWFATLSAIVAWRRARRSVEAIGVRPGETPRLRAGIGYAGPLVLERHDGSRHERPWPPCT